MGPLRTNVYLFSNVHVILVISKRLVGLGTCSIKLTILMYNKRNRERKDDENRLSKTEDVSDESISEFEASEEFIPSKRQRKQTCTDTFQQQWIDKYTPTRSEDICINPRKLKEVKETLSNMISGIDPTKLLILTGPSGSSKSTTIKVLANEIIPRSATSNNFESYMTRQESTLHDNWIEYIDTIVTDTPQSKQFSEFLNDARYRIGSNLSIILIEDLPNIFHADTLSKFRGNLNEWVNTDHQLPPLVLCLSEIELTQEQRNQDYFNIENNLTVDTLLGREFLSQRGKVKQIKFNSIAASFMKKSMNKIVNEERRAFNGIAKTSINDFSSHIIESGDIRSAISNLQFWSGLSKKGRGEIFNSLRENQLNLFHAIGKVIYSSSKYRDLDEEESDYLSIKTVLDNYGNNSLLNLSILENYHIYNDLNYGIEIASEITNNLSISDILNNFDEGKETGIRSTRNQLRRVSGRQSQRMNVKFPRHFKMIKEYNKTKREIGMYRSVVNECHTSFNDLNLIDGYYLPLIYNKQQHNKLKYGRLGGLFKQIVSDGDLPVLEEDIACLYAQDQFQRDIDDKMKTVQEDEEILSDPIETDIDSDDEIFNDSIDETQIHRLVTQSRSQTHKLESEDEFLSDPELDQLILAKNY